MGLRSKSLFRQAADTLSHFYKPCFEVHVWYTRTFYVQYIIPLLITLFFCLELVKVRFIGCCNVGGGGGGGGPYTISVCSGKRRVGGQKGRQGRFSPSPLKIFPFKNIFQDLHFRRWTADRVGQVAPSVLTKLFPTNFFLQKKTFSSSQI